MNLDLSARDQERGKFAFSIYDFDGSGRMDGFYLGDVLRALNLNPTNAVLQNLGGTFRKREKIFTVEEFLPAYSECKKIKNAGSFEDFMEVLKTYDKMEDGNVVVSELEHILLHLGERMEKSEIDAVFADCLPEEDDEGCIEYEHFLRKLCEGFI
ncbi:unnamed protein product [Meganyctiphanes norvegica]|uniref:EF-hand domain-containing protein n=1 Tax=Meganyctiphanes norvegica TaxID=48144 RepID=A0AAV2QK99_MEGNR